MTTYYTYKDIDEVLIETEEYTKKIQEYQEYADSEDVSIKEAWEGMGCDHSWEEEEKQLKISCMINKKILKSIHNLKDGKFYYYLC